MKMTRRFSCSSTRFVFSLFPLVVVTIHTEPPEASISLSSFRIVIVTLLFIIHNCFIVEDNDLNVHFRVFEFRKHWL